MVKPRMAYDVDGRCLMAYEMAFRGNGFKNLGNLVAGVVRMGVSSSPRSRIGVCPKWPARYRANLLHKQQIEELEK